MRLMFLVLLTATLAACSVNAPSPENGANWSILQQRYVHADRQHDIALQHNGQPVYVILSEDKMYAEIFASHLPRVVLESVKGGYVDADSHLHLQRHENGWQIRQH